MGQHSSSRKNADCGCGCGGWERSGRGRADAAPPTTSVHRYMWAMTERLTGRECGRGGGEPPTCRRRRGAPASAEARSPCLCTRYRPLEEAAHDQAVGSLAPMQSAAQPLAGAAAPARDDRLSAVLTLGSRDLRRQLDAFGNITAEIEDGAAGEPTGSRCAEVYVLSVASPLRVLRPLELPQLELRPLELQHQHHHQLQLADLELEDAEEAARARRAREIAEGVDAPPTYTSHLQVVCSAELRALMLRAGAGAVAGAGGVGAGAGAGAGLLASGGRVHTQVDYIHCLVPDLRAITACCFYWGKMDRYEAERLLDNKPEGTFLLRDSAQEEHLFSVSFRKYGRSLHARIEHYNHQFSFDSHDPAVFSAPTVTALIDHYKDPTCVMFFEPMLTAPLPRAQPFSLQQLARAAIVSCTTYDGVEELPLPGALRAYLKEYHYRQRVRVRRLEPYSLAH